MNVNNRGNEQMPGDNRIEEPTDQFTFLRERELARRWRTSQRTLQRWRADGYGPAYVIIGGAIRYRFSDICDFERTMSRGGERS